MFRGIGTLVLIFSIFSTHVLYQQQQTRDMIQICEDDDLINIVEPVSIGGSIIIQ